jgi:probable phosphomutase (TIGR03848 family)
VPTVILLRHGRSSANVAGVLAGRSPGVELDETGRAQAEKVIARLDGVPLAAIVCSPMTRCQQTVAPLAAARELTPLVEPGLSEVDYGSWTGSELKALAKEPLWKVVQAHPSAAVFPEGEGLAGMQARAVAAIRKHDAAISAEHGPRAVWLADALAVHLDNFQRIVVDTCSISVISYTPIRPFVGRVNDVGGDVASLIPPPEKAEETEEGEQKPSSEPSSEAVVGGNT